MMSGLRIQLPQLIEGVGEIPQRQENQCIWNSTKT